MYWVLTFWIRYCQLSIILFPAWIPYLPWNKLGNDTFSQMPREEDSRWSPAREAPREIQKVDEKRGYCLLQHQCHMCRRLAEVWANPLMWFIHFNTAGSFACCFEKFLSFPDLRKTNKVFSDLPSQVLPKILYIHVLNSFRFEILRGVSVLTELYACYSPGTNGLKIK